jgi:hypothetical protein
MSRTPYKSALNYAKQTQFPKYQNAHKLLFYKALWTYNAPSPSVKTNPIKPNFTSHYERGIVFTLTEAKAPEQKKSPELALLRQNRRFLASLWHFLALQPCRCRPQPLRSLPSIPDACTHKTVLGKNQNTGIFCLITIDKKPIKDMNMRNNLEWCRVTKTAFWLNGG